MAQAIIAVMLCMFAGAAAATERLQIWRVERPGVATSYVVASFIAPDGKLPAELERLAASTHTLVLEMDLDPAALLPALPAALESNAGRKGPTVEPMLFRRALALLHRRGVTGEKLAHLRPWALGLSVAEPPPAANPVELELLHRAQTQKKNVRTLESLAESVSDLDTIPVSEQERMIRTGLARGDRSPVLLEELLAAWRNKDGNRIQQLLVATRLRLEPYRTDAHQKRLARRLATILQEGNALVVIDRSATDGGLIRQLTDAGWKARPLGG